MKKNRWFIGVLLGVAAMAVLRAVPLLRGNERDAASAVSPAISARPGSPSVPADAGPSPSVAPSEPAAASLPPDLQAARVKVLTQEAQRALRSRRLDAAANLVQELAAIDPNSGSTRSLQEDLSKAVREAEEREKARLVSMYQREGQRTMNAGDMDQARAYLRTAEEIDPVNTRTFQLLQQLDDAEYRREARRREEEFKNRQRAPRELGETGITARASVAAPAAAAPAAGVADGSALESAGTDEYTIQPEDVLQITVYEEPDLTTKARVGRAGDIVFPMLGRVQVAGLTVSQLQDKLTMELGADYLVHPQVQVFIETPRSVFVTGEVVKPGSYPTSTEKSTTVMELISMAGGFTEEADLNGTRIIRVENGQKVTIRVRVTDIIRKGDKSADVKVRPEDIVYVPESFF